MKIWIWIWIWLPLLLCVACGPPEMRERTKEFNQCTMESAERRAAFIIQCITAGNPKSDEEPEDWIGKCQSMAEDTLCEKRSFVVTEERKGSYWREFSRRPLPE